MENRLKRSSERNNDLPWVGNEIKLPQERRDKQKEEIDKYGGVEGRRIRPFSSCPPQERDGYML